MLKILHLLVAEHYVTTALGLLLTALVVHETPAEVARQQHEAAERSRPILFALHEKDVCGNDQGSGFDKEKGAVKPPLPPPPPKK